MTEPALNTRSESSHGARPAPAVRQDGVREDGATNGHTVRRQLEPRELARWVELHHDALVGHWSTEVRARVPLWNEGHGAILNRFFELLVSMLPATLGPYRDEVEPLWLQVSELFGSVAAHRGLAAGEVIEEFQVMREGLIRLLYAEPPADGAARLSLRDILWVNHIVDRGVTQSSVGHTDALFFTLFQGSGVPETLDDELIGEVLAQLDQLESEFRSIMASLRSPQAADD